MTADEEKTKFIESLSYTLSLTDYSGQPMTREAFLAKIERSEEAASKGEVTDHEEVKKITVMWSRK